MAYALAITMDATQPTAPSQSSELALTSVHEKKGKAKESDNGKATVAIVNIANQSEEHLRKVLAIRNFQEHPFESTGKP